MKHSKKFVLLLVIGVLAARANAWGSKEHIMLTRLAVEKLLADATTPAGLREWLTRVTPDIGSADDERTYFMTARVGAAPNDLKGLSYWVIQPDVRSGDHKTPVPPCNVPEQMNHFIDLEYLNTEADRRVYHHDLSSLPDITTFSRDPTFKAYQDAGALPFAVEYAYKNLVDCFRAGRLEPAIDPKDENHALKWAAFLAHYMEDNTQPLHATQDFKAVSYFADKRNPPNVHTEIEYRMVDDPKVNVPELRAEYWEEFTRQLRTLKDPIKTNDLWLATLQVSAEAYRQLPLMGLAAMEASGQKGTPDKPTGAAKSLDTVKFFHFTSNVTGKNESVLQMKARQQAWAVTRVAATFRRAWDEAHPKK